MLPSAAACRHGGEHGGGTRSRRERPLASGDALVSTPASVRAWVTACAAPSKLAGVRGECDLAGQRLGQHVVRLGQHLLDQPRDRRGLHRGQVGAVGRLAQHDGRPARAEGVGERRRRPGRAARCGPASRG